LGIEINRLNSIPFFTLRISPKQRVENDIIKCVFMIETMEFKERKENKKSKKNGKHENHRKSPRFRIFRGFCDYLKISNF
jgi:hypothetical protein